MQLRSSTLAFAALLLWSTGTAIAACEADAIICQGPEAPGVSAQAMNLNSSAYAEIPILFHNEEEAAAFSRGLEGYESR